MTQNHPLSLLQCQLVLEKGGLLIEEMRRIGARLQPADGMLGELQSDGENVNIV
jgi:hypothetical protein